VSLLIFFVLLNFTLGLVSVALAHIAFKVLGVALALPFIGPFTAFVAHTAADPARQIANAHTFFNVGMSLLFLPFTPWAARAIEAAVPADEPGHNPFKTRYLDERSLDQPSLALGQATREALRMADCVTHDPLAISAAECLGMIFSGKKA